MMSLLEPSLQVRPRDDRTRGTNFRIRDAVRFQQRTFGTKQSLADQKMDAQMDQATRPTMKSQAADRAPDGLEPGSHSTATTQSGSAEPDPANSSPGTAVPVANTRADDEWRRWIAENLMTGEPPERILEAMELRGFSSEEAIRELKAATESPYVKGSLLLRSRLAKRDWLLAVYRCNHRLHPQSNEISRRHRLSREELLCDFYATNRPVVITGMLDDWPAMRKWNLDYFSRTFGDRQVEVRVPPPADSSHDVIQRERYVTSIPFGDFVEIMRTAGETDDFHLTAHHASGNRKALSGLWDDIRPMPEYLASGRPAGLLWMAPRGSTLPFQHALANNLTAQVFGRTRFKIAPSWDMPLMRNTFHWFAQVDGRLVAPQTGPPRDGPQIHELVLEPGEVLFLPVGWLHHVEAIEISVTATFANFIFDNDYSSDYSTYGAV